jgi:hypothetical protein
MENRSLAQAADALGKLGGQPRYSEAWPVAPGAGRDCPRDGAEWEELADQDPEVQLSLALNRATVDLTEHQSDLAEAQANLADVQAESNPGPAPTDNVFSGNTQSRVRQ